MKFINRNIFFLSVLLLTNSVSGAADNGIAGVGFPGAMNMVTSDDMTGELKIFIAGAIDSEFERIFKFYSLAAIQKNSGYEIKDTRSYMDERTYEESSTQSVDGRMYYLKLLIKPQELYQVAANPNFGSTITFTGPLADALYKSLEDHGGRKVGSNTKDGIEIGKIFQEGFLHCQKPAKGTWCSIRTK